MVVKAKVFRLHLLKGGDTTDWNKIEEEEDEEKEQDFRGYAMSGL